MSRDDPVRTIKAGPRPGFFVAWMMFGPTGSGRVPPVS